MSKIDSQTTENPPNAAVAGASRSKNAKGRHRAPVEQPHRWLPEFLLSLDQPFRFATRFASVGVVGVIFAAVVQYSSWRDEKDLNRHKEELTNAISAFSEISGALSAVMNLQQILFFTYQAYSKTNDLHERNTFIANGKEIGAQYVAQRTKLRQSIDVLTAKADLFIDRPATPESSRIAPVSEAPQVISNRDILRGNSFSCQRDMPYPNVASAGRINVVPVGKILIAWSRSRWHVAAFYYCLEEIHTELLPVRVWASSDVKESGVDSEPRDKTMVAFLAKNDDQSGKTDENKAKNDLKSKYPDEGKNTLIPDFDRETTRLNEFMALAIQKIEEMRLKSKENGFFRHQFCLFCEN